jgi:hypothetical protein
MSKGDSPSTSHSQTSDPVTHWKVYVEAAMVEQDPAKILALVHAAEEAIFNRRRRSDELSAEREVERGELTEASNALLKLKVDKLGWKLPLSK